MQYNKVNTSQKYQLLVAHHRRASDPSKGVSGNPSPIRRGFECQNISNTTGFSQIGVFSEKKVKLAIQVNSVDFFNERLGGAPPFYDKDEIHAYASRIPTLDQLPSIKAGDNFGQLAGGGVGVVADVASELARALNEKRIGISASVDDVDNTLVNIKTESIDDDLVLTIVSYSYKLLNGVPPFVVKDSDGNVVYDPDEDDRGVGVVVKRNEDVDPIKEF
jgi:hypothetical protein